MIKTFTLKLNTEITIDFTSWGLSDAEQRGGNATRNLVMIEFFAQNGMDEFEIAEKNGCSLSEVMAAVLKDQAEDG